MSANPPRPAGEQSIDRTSLSVQDMELEAANAAPVIAQMQEFTQTMQSMYKELSAKKAQLNESHVRVVRGQEDLQARQAECERLAAELSRAQEAERRLLQQADQQRARLEAASGESARLEQQLKESVQASAEESFKLGQLLKISEERERRILQLEQELLRTNAETQSKLAEGEAAQARKQKQLETVAQENDQLKKARRDAAEAADARLADLGAEKHLLEESLMQITDNYKQLAEANRTMKLDYDAVSENCRRAKDTIDDYAAESIRREKELGELRAANERLQEQQTGLTKQLENQRTQRLVEVSAQRTLHEKELADLRTEHTLRARQAEIELKNAQELFQRKEAQRKEETKALSAQAEELKQANRGLVAKLDQCGQDLLDNKRHISELNDQSRRQAERFEAEARCLATDLQTLRQTVANLENAERASRQELSLLHAQRTADEQEKKVLEAQALQLRGDVSNLKAVIDQQSKEELNKNTVMFELQQQLGSAKEQLCQLNNSLSERELKVNQLETRLAERSLAEQTVSKQHDLVVAENNNLRSKLVQLEQGRQRVEEQLKEADLKALNLTSQSTALRVEMDLLNDRLRAGQERDQQSLRQIQDLTAQVDQLSRDQTQLQQQCEHSSQAEQSLRAKLNEQYDLRTSVQSKLEDLQERNGQLTAELVDRNDQLRRLETGERAAREQRLQVEHGEKQLLSEKRELENCLCKYNNVFRKHLKDDPEQKRRYLTLGSLQVLDPDEVHLVLVELGSTLNDIESTNVDYEHALVEKGRQVQTFQQKFEKMRARAEQFEQRLHTLNAENAGLTVELEQARKEFDSKEAELKIDRKYVNEKMAKLEQMAKDMRKDKLLLQDENGSLRSLKSTLEQKLADYKQHIKDGERKIDELREELRQYRLKVGQTSTERDDQSCEILILKGRVEEGRTELARLQDALNKANNMLSESSAKEKHSEKSVQELRQKLDLHQNSSKEVIRKMNRLEEQIAQLTTEKIALEEDAERKVGALDEATQSIEDLARKNQLLDKDLTLYRNMLNKLCSTDASGSSSTATAALVSTPTNDRQSGPSTSQSSGEAQKLPAKRSIPKPKQIRFDESTQVRKSTGEPRRGSPAEAGGQLDHMNANLKTMSSNFKDVKNRIRSLQSYMENESGLKSNLLSESLSKLLLRAGDNGDPAAPVGPSSKPPDVAVAGLDAGSVLADINRILNKNKSDFLNDAERVSSELKLLETESEQFGAKAAGVRQAIERTEAEEQLDQQQRQALAEVRARKLKDAQRYAETVIRQQEHSRRKHGQLTESRLSAMRGELFQSFDANYTPALFKKPAHRQSADAEQVTSTPMQHKSDRVKQRLDHKFK